MDLRAAARRGGNMLTGGDAAGQAAVLASTAMVGTSFGPGLLPRPSLDQALATGIVAATNHGLVMTSQSACAVLARRFAGDDGRPSDSARADKIAISALHLRRCSRVRPIRPHLQRGQRRVKGIFGRAMAREPSFSRGAADHERRRPARWPALPSWTLNQRVPGSSP